MKLALQAGDLFLLLVDDLGRTLKSFPPANQGLFSFAEFLLKPLSFLGGLGGIDGIR